MKIRKILLLSQAGSGGRFFTNDNSLDNEMSKKDVITLETGQCLSPVTLFVYCGKTEQQNKVINQMDGF